MTDDATQPFDPDELRNLIAQALDLPVDEVTDDASFVEDLGVDSLMALEIAVVLEKRYGVLLEDADLRAADSFDGVQELLRDKLSAQSTA
ncbi:MAG: acyl carrier protein [Actinomycetota bacterium]|nr:acyl carrier protein [Actinomycetota bacterium]